MVLHLLFLLLKSLYINVGIRIKNDHGRRFNRTRATVRRVVPGHTALWRVHRWATLRILHHGIQRDVSPMYIGVDRCAQTNGTRYLGHDPPLYSTNPRHTTVLPPRPLFHRHAGIVRRPWAQHRRCGHQARRISRNGRLSIVWKEIPVLVPPLIPARARPPQTLSSTA